MGPHAENILCQYLFFLFVYEHTFNLFIESSRFDNTKKNRYIQFKFEPPNVFHVKDAITTQNPKRSTHFIFSKWETNFDKRILIYMNQKTLSVSYSQENKVLFQNAFDLNLLLPTIDQIYVDVVQDKMRNLLFSVIV